MNKHDKCKKVHNFLDEKVANIESCKRQKSLCDFTRARDRRLVTAAEVAEVAVVAAHLETCPCPCENWLSLPLTVKMTSNPLTKLCQISLSPFPSCSCNTLESKAVKDGPLSVERLAVCFSFNESETSETWSNMNPHFVVGGEQQKQTCLHWCVQDHQQHPTVLCMLLICSSNNECAVFDRTVLQASGMVVGPLHGCTRVARTH